MHVLTLGIDIILFVFLILIPTIASLIAKRKETEVPKILQVPSGVKITTIFIILFTIYFSCTMSIGIK